MLKILKTLLNFAYWFDLRPYTELRTIEIMTAFFILLIVIGAGLKIWVISKGNQLEKYQIKLAEKYILLLISMGSVGIIITALRYERVQILASRFWLIVWLIAVILWLIPIIKYQLKTVPQARKQAEERKLFRKYLPKKK